MFRWMVYILINLREQTERLNALFFLDFHDAKIGLLAPECVINF